MLKDICVHFDGTDDDEVRLGHGEMIATLFHAHLMGVYTNRMEVPILAAPDYGGIDAAVLAEAMHERQVRGDEAESRLRKRLARLSLSHELRRVEDEGGSLADAVASLARSADLFVMSRPWGGGQERRWPELLEGVLFNGARAVYLVPPDHVKAQAPRKVLIGWRDTRETARAVAEAIPFMKHADSVVLAIVDERGVVQDADEADMARHLNRHGIEVEVRLLGDWPRAADGLLDEARRLEADLLVMGGYGHSRFREWITGGNTRSMLTECPVPVLMAH